MKAKANALQRHPAAQYPVWNLVRQWAQRAGTKSDTDRGRLAAALTYRRFHRVDWMHRGLVRMGNGQYPPMARLKSDLPTFTDAQRLARRCAAKPRWAKSQARKLWKRALRLGESARTVAQVERWRAAQETASAFPYEIDMPNPVLPHVSIIPLTGISNNQRMVRWLFPTLRSHVKWDVQYGWENEIDCDQNHETVWKNGTPRTGTPARHVATIRSYGVLHRNGNLTVCIGITQRTFTPPEGTVFLKDRYGFKLALADSRNDDYHPTWHDFLNEPDPDVSRKWLAKLLANRERRLQAEAAEAATRADMEGVYVCVADSLKAGNCLAGTRAFAERHHLDVRRHYTALELLAQANGDSGRVRLAIQAAIHRHRRETAQGYATLADHAIPADA